MNHSGRWCREDNEFANVGGGGAGKGESRGFICWYLRLRNMERKLFFET